MKIGIVQTGGIGDIIIALPIAKYLSDQGHRVLWPIYEPHLAPFRQAAPYVEFLPLKGCTGDWMIPIPVSILRDNGCDRVIPLQSYVGGRPELVVNQRLAEILKFDQYKYAIMGVPFREKWNLTIARNREREEQLFKNLVHEEDYAVCHLTGSNFRASFDVGSMAAGKQVVEITNVTDNFFDWLSIIERASLRVMIDSCFSNLTDQLQFPGRKIFLVRSAWKFTPVLLGDWTYVNQTEART